MKFTVKFVRVHDLHDSIYFCQVEEQALGLNFLYQARNVASVPALQKELVDEKAQQTWLAAELELTEEEAERAGGYTESNARKVLIDETYARSFVSITPLVESNPETGEVLRVSAVWTVDEAALKAAWVAAGYPGELNADADE